MFGWDWALAIMARLLLCVLALCAAGAFANPSNKVEKMDPEVLKERQLDLLILFNHIHEPICVPKLKEIASSWTFESNFELFANQTAVKTYAGMLKNKWYLPRAVPFSVNTPAHAFEAMTLFNVLYSAKDYETFYKTAVYLRDIVNENLYVYVLSIAVIYRKDTQGLSLPPIYEIFPSYFNNGEIMTTAQRINTHGAHNVKDYPSTYMWDDNVVVRWNATAWPYYDDNFPLTYFTHDWDLNAAHYFQSLVSPFWLGHETVPLYAWDRRGEVWWFAYKQLLARYYMERLSNGLGEIPEMTTIVKDGYFSGLLYHNGVPFPSRPDYYRLDSPQLTEEMEEVVEFEKRIWEAIDKGFYVNRKGEQVDLLTQGGLNVLGNLIESNADSPNRWYYKDFIRVWKMILGNSIKSNYQYVNKFSPLVLPSPLEHFQTALRDPAFYMIWKRISKLFVYWQKQMPLYKPEELSYPVAIEKVDVDKLVTYFEYAYMNVTNHLFMSEAESKGLYDDVKVLVQRPILNHKPFSVRVSVKSDVAKKVLVKFFLAPKYDSKGYEIPLQLNTENFFQLDWFVWDLPAGESVITRESTSSIYSAKKGMSGYEMYEKIIKGQWTPTKTSMTVFPHHLQLPKGKIGGMPFQIMVYIQEWKGIQTPYTADYHPADYPTDRPLYSWQVKGVKNMWFEDVLIYHKEVPEVDVPLTY